MTGFAGLTILLVALMNAPRVHPALPAGARSTATRLGAVAIGGALAVALAAAVAAAGPSVFDWLGISAATGRIGAGVVLVVVGIHALLVGPPSAEPALDGWGAGLVPVAVPFLATPALAVLALSAGTDQGAGAVAGATAIGAATVALGAVRPATATAPVAGRVVAWGGRLLAAVLVAGALALVVEGIFDI